MPEPTFPRVAARKRGYNVEQVDAFLDRARTGFQGRGDGPSSSDVRETGFDLQRGGYETAEVDAALDRLEDALAAREREHAVAVSGQPTMLADVRGRATEILTRLKRDDRQKFRRAGLLRQGYDRAQVDAFCGHLVDYFESREKLTVAEVRAVAFTPRNHGYSESQVDAFIDAVVDVMLAVRQPSRRS